MKVALINLATKRDHAFLNLGAVYMAATIRESGHDVKLIDLVRHPLEKINIEQIIGEYRPDLIAFSGIITTYYQFEPLSNRLKKAFPDIPQLVGGSLETTIPLVEAHTNVDFVCTGEGELPMVELLNEFEGDRNWANVSNLAYREGNKFKRSLRQGVIVKDLDTLPFPAYDLIDIDFYSDYQTSVVNKVFAQFNSKERVTRSIPMIFTRGCPYTCSFCYRLIRNWRHHSYENILGLLKKVKEEYHVDHIYLYDELIFVNRVWFIELCEKIAEANLNLKFVCGGGKPNLVTEEVVIAMKKAGFQRIGYGLESGSQTILDRMNKKTTVEQNYNAIEMTLKYGMFSMSNFVFGHPGENKQTLKETFSFINSLTKLQEKYNMINDDFQIFYATPYPGTPMYDHAVSKGLITDERDYLIKVTAQVREGHHVNMSEFKTFDEFKHVLFKELKKILIKKYFRRNQYKAMFRQCFILLVGLLTYALTFKKFAELGEILHLLRKHRRDLIREKHDDLVSHPKPPTRPAMKLETAQIS